MKNFLSLILCFIWALCSQAEADIDRLETQRFLQAFHRGMNEGYDRAYEQRYFEVHGPEVAVESMHKSKSESIKSLLEQIRLQVLRGTTIEMEAEEVLVHDDKAKGQQQCFANFRGLSRKYQNEVVTNFKNAGEFLGHFFARQLGRQPLITYIQNVKFCDYKVNQKKLLNYRNGTLFVGIPVRKVTLGFAAKKVPANRGNFLREWNSGKPLLVYNKSYSPVMLGAKALIGSDIEKKVLHRQLIRKFWTVLNPIGTVALRLKKAILTEKSSIVQEAIMRLKKRIHDRKKLHQCHEQVEQQSSLVEQAIHSLAIKRYGQAVKKAYSMKDDRVVVGLLFALKNNKYVNVGANMNFTSYNELVPHVEFEDSDETLMGDDERVNEYSGGTFGLIALDLVDNIQVDFNTNVQLSPESHEFMVERLTQCN